MKSGLLRECTNGEFVVDGAHAAGDRGGCVDQLLRWRIGRFARAAHGPAHIDAKVPVAEGIRAFEEAAGICEHPHSHTALGSSRGEGEEDEQGVGRECNLRCDGRRCP